MTVQRHSIGKHNM